MVGDDIKNGGKGFGVNQFILCCGFNNRRTYITSPLQSVDTDMFPAVNRVTRCRSPLQCRVHARTGLGVDQGAD